MAALSTPTPASRLKGDQIRVSMARVITGWAFGAIFFQLSAGAVYASFARQLGAGEATFGFLAGVYSLMSFIQIPAARLLEGRVSARQMMLVAGISSRILWVLAAAIPLLHKVLPTLLPREAVLPAFVVCVILSGIGQACTGPAFFTWMSELIPDRLSPTFWAKRQQIGTLTGMCAVLAGGAIADNSGWIKAATGDAFPPLMTYSVILVIAALCGVADIVAFCWVEEPPRPIATPTKVSAWKSLTAPLHEPAIRNYLLFTTVGVIGFGTLGPLLWLFCLEFLDLDKTTTGFMLTIAPLLGIAVSSKMWGDIARDHGTRPMLRFASMGLILIPIGWLLTTRDTVVPLGIMLFLSGVLFNAYEISNINFMTRICPHLPRPPITALFAICAGITFALTTWLCGVLAELLAPVRIEFGGWTFVNFHIIFALSLVPRCINAFVLAPRLQEPEATSTKHVIKLVGINVISTFSGYFGRAFQARGD